MAGKRKPKQDGKKPDKWHLVLVKEIHARPLADLAREMSRKTFERLIDAIGEGLKAELRAAASGKMQMQHFYEKCYVSNGMWCCQTCQRDPMGNEICEPPRCRPLAKDVECAEPLELDSTEHHLRA